MNHYRDIPPAKEIQRPLKNANLIEVVDQWDNDFILAIDLDANLDLINAANFMDIKGLLELACARIATVMIREPVEEVWRIFNIECDMTEEEKAEYAKYPLD
jgi:S-phase kinase-associated protein 1